METNLQKRLRVRLLRLGKVSVLKEIEVNRDQIHVLV